MPIDLSQIEMSNQIKVVIAAAGEGRRSGLSFPKTLYKVNNVPIIIRILKKISFLDKKPTLIVSSKGIKNIKKIVLKHKFDAEFIIQKNQTVWGMH